MLYAIVNLTEDEVRYVQSLVPTGNSMGLHARFNVDPDRVMTQVNNPAAQDEPMGEIWAAAIFGEDSA